VKDPHRLAKTVLSKYFRHSKFSSFQRQLNYFGFHKTEGKGKHAPCVYTNDALAGATINDLLSIKRKTSTQPNRSPGGNPSGSSFGGLGTGGYSSSSTAEYPASPTFEDYTHAWGRVVMYDHHTPKRNRDIQPEPMEYANSMPTISESAPSYDTGPSYDFSDVGMQMDTHFPMLKKTKSMSSVYEGTAEAMMTRQAGQMTLIGHEITPGSFFTRPRPQPVECGPRFVSQSCPSTSSRMAMRSMSEPLGAYDTNSAFSVASQASTTFGFGGGFDDFQPNTATSADSNDQTPMFSSPSPVPPLLDPFQIDVGFIDQFQEEEPSLDQLFASLIDDDLDL
jgi:hypothetical protein